MKKSALIISTVLFTLLISGCFTSQNPNDKTFNIFSIEDDKKLGEQLDQEISSKPDEFPILSETQYPAAYQHLRRIRDNILNSGKVFYKDDFKWQVKIIHNDTILNAFAAPGGYIYVYTGIIKYLDTEHQFAGVLAHEIAHADRRHSTDQLTKIYGIAILLQLTLGNNPNLLAEIAATLVSLKFSRDNEAEADEYSVVYMCPTDYYADGAAAFFEKIQQSGGGRIPEFISTHPDPGNRVSAITAKKNELACKGVQSFDARYQAFKMSLP